MKKSTSHRVVERRRAIQEFIRLVKESTPCADCGKRFPYYVMEHDHHTTAKKHGNISDLLRKTTDAAVIFRELEKTEIVCSNCHKIRTYRRAKKVPHARYHQRTSHDHG